MSPPPQRFIPSPLSQNIRSPRFLAPKRFVDFGHLSAVFRSLLFCLNSLRFPKPMAIRGLQERIPVRIFSSVNLFPHVNFDLKVSCSATERMTGLFPTGWVVSLHSFTPHSVKSRPKQYGVRWILVIEATDSWALLGTTHIRFLPRSMSSCFFWFLYFLSWRLPRMGFLAIVPASPTGCKGRFKTN